MQGASLTYGIVQDLGIAIVTGRYAHDKPFPVEGDLCKQYQVSRSILREAVKMLTAKGLLRARPRQGTWVQPEARWNLLDPDVLKWLLERKFDPSLLLEFNQIRLGFEPAAAARAALADPAHKAEIKAALDRMKAAESGADDPLESDIAFHVSILKASENRFFFQLTELTETALRFSIRRTNDYKGVALADVEDHARVWRAIEAGDPDTASEEMRHLIQAALDLLGKAKVAAEA
ncbi:MAG: FadR/GntR family transcriptional regulator [Caulobacteraceae bacterium]|nr:FadR/GntR family transcriptional regulator [Caulobacteraceae bacterium]